MKKKAQFSLFDGNKISKEVCDHLFDTSLYATHKTYKSYLDSAKLPYTPAEIAKLIHLVEQQIYEFVYFMAHLQFYVMRSSSDWGEMGEQHILLSFARVLLQLPPDQPIESEHVGQFFEKVEENLDRLGIAGMTVDAAKYSYNNKYLTVLGREFKTFVMQNVNPMLRFLGSKKALVTGLYWSSYAYIWGECTYKTVGEYSVMFISKELMRTPSYVIPNVAEVAEHQVVMRDECLYAIFYQKWTPVFEPRVVYQYHADADLVSRISKGIKARAIAVSGAKTQDELIANRKLFVGGIRETIMYHEIGHGITKDYLFNYERVAIAMGINRYHQMPMYDAFIEVLSDFAPPAGGLIGPMWNMTVVAKKDKGRAEQLFYSYLSDVFFFDTDDTHMYDYSEMMCLIMMRYIRSDLSIDFGKMEADLQYHQGDGAKPAKPSLYDRLGDLFCSDMDHLKQMLQKVKYPLEKERDFAFVKSTFLEDKRKYNKYLIETDHAFLSSFWYSMFSFVEKLAPDEAPKIKSHLEKSSKMVMAKLMILTAGRKVAEEYQFQPRQYIYSQFKKLGLLED